MSWLSDRSTIWIPSLLIFFGTILSVTGAVWVISLLMFFGAILSVGGSIWFAYESSIKSDKISELNQQIAETVTGGDSFCYLLPSPARGKLSTIAFHLIHEGEYPVYDLAIKVWDETLTKQHDIFQQFEEHFGYKTKHFSTNEEWLKFKSDPEYIHKNIEWEKKELDMMRKSLIFNDRLGTMTRSFTSIIDPPLVSCSVPPGTDFSKFSQEYSVNIAARNGQYNQKIIIKIRNKRWHIYSKVEKIISDSKRVVVREYESQDMEGFVIKFIK